MSKNNITGDNLISKPTTENYSAGWELLWGKNPGSTVGAPRITDRDIIKASSGCNGKCYNTTGCKGDGC